MYIGTAILVIGFAALIAAVCLLLVGLVYFELINSDIPPGVASPGKLHVVHCWFVGIAVVGRILERLGICDQVNFTRWCRACVMVCKRPVPPGLRIKDVTFGGVPVRVYEPTTTSGDKKRGLVYFHGGGWVFGGIDDYDVVCRYISMESDTVVVSVGYRLAPEHRYPAHLDDCEVVTRHFLSIATADFGVDSRRVAVGGDSAGANLAAALCQRLAKTQDGHLPSPCAQVLIYPALQMADFNLPSYQQNHSVPILFRGRVVFFFLQYLNGDMSVGQDLLDGKHVPAELKLHFKKWLDPANLPPEFRKETNSQQVITSHDAEVYHTIKRGLDPEISPLLAEDDVLCLSPPTFVLTCEFDVLRDDGILFQKRLKDLGVDVTWQHVSDGFHGIMSFFDIGWLTFQSSQKFVRECKTANSTHRLDFTPNLLHRPDVAVRRTALRTSEGIPTRLLLSHHGVPASEYLVTLYDESYGRQTSSTLPTLRSWHSDKLAWVPERSDHPIRGPPTNFGLAETWRDHKEHQQGVVPTLSVYKASYPLHPISAFCRSRHVIAPKHFSSSQLPAKHSNEKLALSHRPCRHISSNLASPL